jgi:hypothetical protein
VLLRKADDRRSRLLLLLPGVRSCGCHARSGGRRLKAYVKSGAPEPAIYRRKSENHLRQFSFAKQVSAIVPHLTRPPKPMHQRKNSTIDSQGERCARKEKMFPTLAEVTSAILARKAKHVGDAVVADTSTTNPATAEMSLDAIPLPLHTSTRQAKPGVSRGDHTPALVQLRSAPQQTVPLKVDKKITARRRQPSILTPTNGRSRSGE